MPTRLLQIIVTASLFATTGLRAQQPAEVARTFSGHLGSVNMADLTPDGSKIATASADHSLKLWNAETGEEIATLSGHQSPVTTLAINPEGTVLASGAQDNTIKLWDIPQTEPLQTLSGHQGPATDFALSPDARMVVSASQDKTARIWNTLEEGEPFVVEGHQAEVTAAAYRADQNQIATSDAAGFIRLWRTIDHQSEGVLGAHRGGVASLFYHSNNQQLVSTGTDGLVKVWQIPTVPPREIPGNEQPVDTAIVSTDGQLVAAAAKINGRPTVTIRKVEDGTVAATLLGHEAPITALAFNSNHTQLATGSEDKTVRIWDLADSKFPELLNYGEHEAAVRAVAFSADNTQVFSAGDGNVIRQWNAADGAVVRTLEGHTAAVSELAVSGTTLASGSADGSIRLWTTSNGAPSRTIQHGAPVKQLALTADGARIAAWGENKQLKLWNAGDGELLETLASDAEGLTSLAFSSNNQRLAATVGDLVRTWDVTSFGELQFFAEHASPPRAASYLPDAKTLVSIDARNGMRISTVAALRSMAAHETSILDAAPLQGGNLLATVAGTSSVKIWTTSNGQMAREIEAEGAKLVSIAARPDSQQIAAASEEGRVFLWNPGNGASAADFETPAAVRALSFSADNQKLAVAGDDQQLRFYALDEQELLQEYAVDSPIAALAFLPDSKRVMATHESGNVVTWSYASPTFTRNLTGHGGGIFSLAFSGDGTTLVSGSADNTIRIWNVAAGNQRAALSGHQGTVFGLALSADSSLIVSAGGDGTVRLWDQVGGRQLKQIDAPGALYSVAIHPDGKTVAAAGIDRQVFIYDVFAGSLQKTLEGHPDFVYRVAFNRAGNRLLSCGYGGHLLVWDFPSGKLLYETRVKGVLNSVAYGPEEKWIVVASDDGTAKLMPLPAAAQ